ANPINQGPNYKCSQEISLRLLNWIFAVYFYKHSPCLTETFFQRMVHYIYWQLHHIDKNINFSRIAVRNNHAITETLTLYIVSTLFPWYSESAKWKREGKKWFEQEIAYQIYDDGSYLQFSMNYHRVVIQLLTWAIRIAELHQERFTPVVYAKAYKSVNFLYQCQEDSNGYLPNYGSNDGALFFKLSDNDYRDYRPQLNALHLLLTGQSLYREEQEDIYWYGGYRVKGEYPPLKKEKGVLSFPTGGYYLIREEDTLTFIRCGNHKDRPAHADNLHMDVWYQGKNLLPDGGTYKYNTDNKTLKYFMGTESHNTVMLEKYDQMLKGARFIWYNWTQVRDVVVNETEDTYVFSGTIHCFTCLGKKITHTRKVTKRKEKPEWNIEDIITDKPAQLLMRQIWHIMPGSAIQFESDTERIEEITYYSSYYGAKKEISQTVFQTNRNTIHTHISINA
ncbi:MAG: heparinase II/III family protein, partial [Tannerellaceae bacterium]|nr:heparinase II/III family protein [Tannerellaceae bacterium]